MARRRTSAYGTAAQPAMRAGDFPLPPPPDGKPPVRLPFGVPPQGQPPQGPSPQGEPQADAAPTEPDGELAMLIRLIQQGRA
jgi:hypothetical protein